jgi:hypothetical protein
MAWLALLITVLAAGIVGFLGIAIASTDVGQYTLAGIVCVIATYWLTLASDHRAS